MNSKNFFTFKSLRDSDFSLGNLPNNLDFDEDMPIDITTIKSSLVRYLLLMQDTIAFHGKLSVVLIREQQDDVQKLHEYHKRWQAFIGSMIKMDELLIPIARGVNEVYKILYPGYPAFPTFSILRFFIRIWYKEVYGSLYLDINNYLVGFLKTFHQGGKEYSKERKLTKKSTRNKTSLSDYFPSNLSKTPLIGSVSSFGISPLLKSNNDIRTPKPKKYANERILEFEDGQNTIIDLDMLYGAEPTTNIPGFDRCQKEMLKQALIDLTDLSLNEYTIHYIGHSEVKLGSPYESIKDRIKLQLIDFYKFSIGNMPFDLWSEVIAEHSQILMNILPLTLQKELTDLRLEFTKKYTKNKIQKLMNEFEKCK